MKLIPRKGCKIRHTDEAILEAMQTGGNRLTVVINNLIEDLCKCKYFENVVFKYVMNNGGNRQKAEDVLEDGLIKLSELLHAKKYKGGKFEAYAIQVCKNIWLNMSRKKDERVHLVEDYSIMDRPEEKNPESILAGKERSRVLKLILEKCLDEACLQLLQLKLIEGKRHEEIAKLMNFSSANSSKQKLDRCKKKALSCIEKNDNYLKMMEAVDFLIPEKN